MSRKAQEITGSMRAWFEKQEKYTALEIKAHNHAILSAAEFIRRLDDYDETRSLAMMELLINKDKSDI